MAFRNFHKPFAATFALLSIGSLAVLACSDDDGTIPQDGFDAGPGVKVPDAGGEPDTGPVATDEFTVDIGAGFATACALSNKGHVKCWGDGVDGEMLFAPQEGKKCFDVDDQVLLDCDYRVPVDVAVPYPVEQLTVGYKSVCVIANDNGTRRLGCWGDPEDGRLSSYAPDAGLATSIVWIPLPAEPKRIAGDRFFKVVELVDGTIWGWGDNSYGHYAGPVLGINPTPSKVWPPAGNAPGADAGAILDIATQKYSSFVLTAGGLYGTGDNSENQQQSDYPAVEEYHAWTKLPTLRNGSDAGALADAGGDPIAKLFRTNGRALGGCYITTSGKAYCWGDNSTGQNGAAANADVGSVVTPTQIDLPVGRTATQIAIATGGICAITDDGAVYCWGDDSRGAAGQTPSGEARLDSPKVVPGVSDAKAIAVGTNYFACALTGAHKTFCWGENGYAQQGYEPDGGSMQFSPTPHEVPLTW